MEANISFQRYLKMQERGDNSIKSNLLQKKRLLTTIKVIITIALFVLVVKQVHWYDYEVIEDGKAVDSFSGQDWIFNRSLVLNIEIKPGQLIEPIHSSANDINNQTEFILFKTGFEQFRGKDVYWRENPGLAPELAEFLIAKCPNLRAVGMDFISISSFKHKEKGRMAHELFLKREILIFEDMRLCELQSYSRLDKIIALPLRFQNGDGAPVSILGQIAEGVE